VARKNIKENKHLAEFLPNLFFEQDLGTKDLEREKIYLVCKIVRIGERQDA